MKKQISKMIVSAALAGSMVLGMTGCGSNADDTADYVTQLSKISKYVKVGDYKNLNITLDDDYAVDEAYLNQIVSYMYSTVATYVDAEDFVTDRAVEDGDMINLDYTGYKDGVAFDGGSATNYGLWIGSGSFIDGFEEGLIGVMPGETVDLDLTFPENYSSEDLAGAAVTFTCTVNGIITEEKIFEAWNEQMDDEADYIYSLEELNNYYYNYLSDQATSDYETDLQNAIIEQITADSEFKTEFPAHIITFYQEQAQSVLESYATQYGYDTDTFAQYAFGMTADEYIKDNSYEQLQTDAILQYIAEEEGLVVSDEDLDTRLRELLVSYGYDDVDSKMEEVDKENYRMYFIQDDVMEYLTNNCIVTPDLRNTAE